MVGIAPNEANGIEPESNHTSITSGTRLIISSQPDSRQANVTSSTNGRCGSSSATPERLSSSASEPITWRCPAGHLHTGNGVPQ